MAAGQPNAITNPTSKTTSPLALILILTRSNSSPRNHLKYAFFSMMDEEVLRNKSAEAQLNVSEVI